MLLFLVVPGHVFFNWVVGLLHTGQSPPSSALFTSLYLAAALAQVSHCRVAAAPPLAFSYRLGSEGAGLTLSMAFLRRRELESEG